jgi:acetyltransferase-like isoleucine patch superfamily enzyme
MSKLFNILLFILKNKISIIRTIYFNFHYFPVPIAIKFPIILHRNVRLKEIKGKIVLDSSLIKSGMVRIGKENYGFQWGHVYTIWEHLGGTVFFQNNISIGRGSFVSIGKSGTLKIEHDTEFGGDDRIICMKSVTIKANTKVAWDVQIIDTDYIATMNTITNAVNYSEKPIIIGERNWLCFGSTFLKGSVTPNNCIVSAKTCVKSDYSAVGEFIVLANKNNPEVVAKMIKYIYDDDNNK